MAKYEGMSKLGDNKYSKASKNKAAYLAKAEAEKKALHKKKVAKHTPVKAMAGLSMVNSLAPVAMDMMSKYGKK